MINNTDTHLLCIVGAGDARRLAVQQDFARIRLINAGQNLHQGRFACAVFSYQGMNLTFCAIQRHVVQRSHARERFGDVSHLQHDVSHV